MADEALQHTFFA
nr:RecName: Full=Heparin lyase; AltName: Full=Heparin eliminase; Short=Heparinase [Bacteroides stercoris]